MNKEIRVQIQYKSEAKLAQVIFKYLDFVWFWVGLLYAPKGPSHASI